MPFANERLLGPRLLRKPPSRFRPIPAIPPATFKLPIAFANIGDYYDVATLIGQNRSFLVSEHYPPLEQKRGLCT